MTVDMNYMLTFITCCLTEADMERGAVKKNSYLWIKHYDNEHNEEIGMNN